MAGRSLRSSRKSTTLTLRSGSPRCSPSNYRTPLTGRIRFCRQYDYLDGGFRFAGRRQNLDRSAARGSLLVEKYRARILSSLTPFEVRAERGFNVGCETGVESGHVHAGFGSAPNAAIHQRRFVIDAAVIRSRKIGLGFVPGLPAGEAHDAHPLNRREPVAAGAD